jgi:hypothetical protein
MKMTPKTETRKQRGGEGKQKSEALISFPLHRQAKPKPSLRRQAKPARAPNQLLLSESSVVEFAGWNLTSTIVRRSVESLRSSGGPPANNSCTQGALLRASTSATSATTMTTPMQAASERTPLERQGLVEESI